MSYYVDYFPDAEPQKPRRNPGLRSFLFGMLFFAIFLFTVGRFWQEGREVLGKMLFSGDSVAAWNALETLAADLKHGIPLEFAAENFYLEILKRGY